MINLAITPQPFATGYLDELDGHKVFFTEYGNPTGQPIVILHGGPGSNSKPKQAKGYDLEKYHIITFDQRGCGKSEPAGKIESNTLPDLIQDMERLRIKLNLDRWFVAGGSWGSTLALAYAQAHPDRVRGLLLSSMFLARPTDVDWSFTASGGVERVFPDLWEQRLSFLAQFQAKPDNAAQVLLQKLLSATAEEAKIITAGVSNWENNLMSAQDDVQILSPAEIGDEDIASTKVYLHYESQHFFLETNQLLNGMTTISNIPTIIVHGRYDLLCPVEQTWEVKKRLNQVDVLILPTSNHQLTAEGEIARKLAFNLFLRQQAAV
jgi:proline iminopeptidase